MDPKTIDASKTALLVIDKQLSYTNANNVTNIVNGEEVNPFDALLPQIDSFIELCRSKGLKIVWTQMIEDVEKSPANIRATMIASGTPTISDPDSDAFGFNGLQPAANELVIIKKYYDAFAQTGLASQLHAEGINTVILVGAYASRCVLGTAFGANGNDFNVIVIEELIGNPSRIQSEIPSTLQIIRSILGFTLHQDELHFSN